MKLKIFFDGSSHGNPGPAGIGVIIIGDSGLLRRISEFIGVKTNNEAEYHALIRGLEAAKSLSADSVQLYSDSRLIVNQIKGLYRVRDEKLRKLYERCMNLLKYFKSFEIINISREENMEADKLANEAVAKYLRKTL